MTNIVLSPRTTAERWDGIPKGYWPKARYRVSFGWDRSDDFDTIGKAFAHARTLLAKPLTPGAASWGTTVEIMDTATEPMTYLLRAERKVVR